MIGHEIKESKAVAISEVAEILETQSGPEPTYEQQIALDHAKKVSAGKSPTKIRGALEQLKTMSEGTIIKIMEIMPKNQMTLKQILAREKRTYTEEDITKILDIIKGK